jgi:hypothetical protein
LRIDGMSKTEKKKYEKPEVKRIDLDGRCSVLGFCKTTGKLGPATTNCKVIGNCSSLGS